MDTLVGTSIGGYTLIKLLGVGGMGSVYLASDPAIDQQVAVKIIRTDMDGYTDSTSAQMALERFRQEARAVARLDHLHILPLYRYGEEETPQGQRAYMIMQYRPEGSLWDWLRRRADMTAGNLQPTQAELSFGLPINWPLGLNEAAEYLQQAASALQYAHDRGIVHRDIKPANFLLRIDLHDKSIHLLLSDFGLAKVFTNNSATNTILGTPTYMAPEQFEGAACPESDQYALAVMVYYMLAGRAPFEGDPMQLMRQHLSAQVPVLNTFNPNIPSYINGIIARALAKHPEQRFSSVTAFAEAFTSAAQGQQATPFSMPGTITPTPGRAGLPASSVNTPGGRPTQGPLVLPGVPDVAAGMGVRNDAATAMYAPPAPTVYPAPGMRGPSDISPQVYGQQTVTPRPGPGSQRPRTGQRNQQVSRRSALGWILGGTAVAVVAAGAGIYFYTQSNSSGSNNNGQVTPPASNGGGSTSSSPLLHTLTGHTAAVNSLSWLADGTQLATGSLDATARLWSPDGSSTGTVISATSAIHAVAWSPDGSTLATGEEDHTIQLWNTSGTLIKRDTGWGALVDALAWLNNTTLYLGTYGEGVHALDITNGKHYGKNSLSRVTSMAFSPGGRYLVAALSSGLVYFMDLSKSASEIATLPAVHGAAYSVAWSPDGSMVVVGYADGYAIVYDANSRSPMSKLKHGGVVYSVAWSPNSTRAVPLLVSGSEDKTVNIWNLATKNQTKYSGHTDAVFAVAWGPNLIASASKDQTAMLWQPPNA